MKNRLFATGWVHAFEEDTAEGAVYRPRGSKLPLSRRPRERLELEADGTARDLRPGARRPLRRAAGDVARRGRGASSFARARAAPQLRIVEHSPDRLVVQTSERVVARRDRLIMASRQKAQKKRRARDPGVRGQRPRALSGRRCGRTSATPRAPLVRPLRIYTLDPSVSDRMGGVATVHVPYEKLEPGPIGSLFAVNSIGAPAELMAAEALDLDDPYLLLSSGLSPTPTNGRFHLQMVYAVCSLTYAAFRRALGRDIAWATTAPADGPLRLVVRPFGFDGSQRRLQPRGRRPVVRLLPRRRQGGRLHAEGRPHQHRAQPRHRRARDDACAARRPAVVVPRSDQRRRARVPRGLLRSRRALPPLQLRRRRRAGDSRVRRHASRTDRC